MTQDKLIEFSWWPSPPQDLSEGQALSQFFGTSSASIKRISPYLKKSKCKPQARISVDLLNYFMVNPAFKGVAPRVIFEDENWIALDCASGNATHPLRYSEQTSCLNFLRSTGRHAPLHVSSGTHEKGLLYRIDIETSGLVLFSKNEKHHNDLRERISNKEVTKTYRALVKSPCTLSGKFSHYFSASGPRGSIMKAGNTETGLKGSIDVRPLSSSFLKGVDLLEVALEGGHRHQIRSQLSALGFPIIGDNVYGEGIEGLPLMLHCYHYSGNSNLGHWSFTSSFEGPLESARALLNVEAELL